ncbi:hypothetical protein Fot_35426 [Forsythia ovata]|uniref:Uncharacterized protein n=1 Tax=Forsythia ovata TaxID=205694 RepID=A0ABD1SPB2_9LAMI
MKQTVVTLELRTYNEVLAKAQLANFKENSNSSNKQPQSGLTSKILNPQAASGDHIWTHSDESINHSRRVQLVDERHDRIWRCVRLTRRDSRAAHPNLPREHVPSSEKCGVSE